MGKGAHNWNRQHVNSNFFSDDPSISQLGAAVEPLFSLRPIFHFPSANFPLSFAQSTTFLCPICHFHFQHFSTGFLFESYFIFVSPSNCMCPIGHFLSPNFPLPCYTLFFELIEFYIQFFSNCPTNFHKLFSGFAIPRGPDNCLQSSTLSGM